MRKGPRQRSSLLQTRRPARKSCSTVRVLPLLLLFFSAERKTRTEVPHPEPNQRESKLISTKVATLRRFSARAQPINSIIYIYDGDALGGSAVCRWTLNSTFAVASKFDADATSLPSRVQGSSPIFLQAVDFPREPQQVSNWGKVATVMKAICS